MKDGSGGRGGQEVKQCNTGKHFQERRRGTQRRKAEREVVHGAVTEHHSTA